MTNDERKDNEAIALLRGWKYHPENSYGEQWLSPSYDWHVRPPDYLHDWQHAGPLQVELWEAGFDMCHDFLDGTFYWWKISDDSLEPLDDGRENTMDVMVATGLDWLAWKRRKG